MLKATNANKFFKYIESYNDFPKKDVIYWDFTPMLEDPSIFRDAITGIMNHYGNRNIDKIAAIEAKGFIIGSCLAYEMKKPLVLIRKSGLLPGMTINERFVKEYGEAEYQMKQNSIKKGENVLIVYDILAGPGATCAAIRLVERLGGVVVGCTYILELGYLKARHQLSNYDILSLVNIKDKISKKD